jgi:hypothetical protein
MNDYFVLRMGKGTVNEIWVPVSALYSPQALHRWVWGEELSDRSKGYRIRVHDRLKEIRTQICKGAAA